MISGDPVRSGCWLSLWKIGNEKRRMNKRKRLEAFVIRFSIF
jgi:hypothetical protein